MGPVKNYTHRPSYNEPVFGYEESEEPNWLDLWSEFEKEFCNYTHEEIVNIIGDKVILSEEIKDYFPLITEVDLRQSQLKVAGEFVRRHHARLAHVLAVNGFPKLTEESIFDRNFDLHNNLAGLVARSHHESLRGMYDRLENNQRMSYGNCHLIFLMAVIRIADLMQITSDRTPLITFKSKVFWSSFSENEWKKHLSLLRIKDVTQDPACLAFEIEPNLDSVQRLYSIRSLLRYFQHELDLVWASLGEAYGETKLSNLKIKFRRVSSELDSPAFLNKLTFEDQPASFKVDLSLIQKLITPLYGNLPEVGIRELIQNGLDAVRERYHLNASIDYKVRVKLYKSEGNNYIEISDDGCGMDANIIENYFLNIGSSFRGSKQWATEYSIEKKSTVSRSGRFGIGMLAGFILGDTIEVTTRRHTTGEYGKALKFSFTLEGKMIQLDRVSVKAVNIGTSIKIKLRPEIDGRLKGNPASWQWYNKLDRDYAEVEYRIDENIQGDINNTENGYWKHVSSLDGTYSNFRWGTKNLTQLHSNMLFVNNLKISQTANGVTNYSKTLDTYDSEPKSWGFDVLFPPVALDDPDLNLPLNLERNGFSEESVPFGGTLYNEIITHYIESAENYDSQPINLEVQRNNLTNTFYGLNRNLQCSQTLLRSQIGLWGVHENGFILSDFALIQAAKIDRIYLISQFVESKRILSKASKNSAIFKFESDRFANKYSRNATIFREQTLLSHFNTPNFLLALLGMKCGIQLNREHYTLFINKAKADDINITQYLSQRNIKAHAGEIAVSYTASQINKHIDFELKDSDFVIEIDIRGIVNHAPQNLFSKRWSKELNSPFLNSGTKRVLE